MHKQYEAHSGRNVDMDIELIFSNVQDSDFSDPLLDDAFRVVLDTYYRDSMARVRKLKGYVFPTVEQFCVEDGRAEYLLELMKIEWHRVSTTDAMFPLELYAFFDNIECAVRIQCDRLPTQATMFVPGHTEGHAITLALLQGARELSSAVINRSSEQTN